MAWIEEPAVALGPVRPGSPAASGSPAGRVFQPPSVGHVRTSHGILLETLADRCSQERRAKRLARSYALQGRVAAIPNEAASVAEALSEFVALVCRDLGHAVGIVSEVAASGEFVPSVAYSEGVRSELVEDAIGRKVSRLALAAHRDGGITSGAEDLGIDHLSALFGGGRIRFGSAAAIRVPPATYVIETYGEKPFVVGPSQRALIVHLESQLAWVAEREGARRSREHFVSTVSHEMRTPLTSILGMLELLESGLFCDLSAAERDCLEAALLEGRLLSRSIETLLVDGCYAERSPGEKSRLTLLDVLARSLRRIEFAAEFAIPGSVGGLPVGSDGLDAVERVAAWLQTGMGPATIRASHRVLEGCVRLVLERAEDEPGFDDSSEAREGAVGAGAAAAWLDIPIGGPDVTGWPGARPIRLPETPRAPHLPTELPRFGSVAPAFEADGADLAWSPWRLPAEPSADGGVQAAPFDFHETLVRWQFHIGSIANEATTLEEGLTNYLAFTCRDLRCEFGRISRFAAGSSCGLLPTGIVYTEGSASLGPHGGSGPDGADWAERLAHRALRSSVAVFEERPMGFGWLPGTPAAPAGRPLGIGWACAYRVADEIFVIERYGSDPVKPRLAHPSLARHLETQLSRVAERQHVQRLKARFVDSISADMTLPLATIRGILDAPEIHDLAARSDEVATMIAMARQDAERLAQVVQDTLTVNRLDRSVERPPLVPVDLAALVKGSVLRCACPQAVSLRIRPGDLTGSTDVASCEQILAQLLSNAAKFSAAEKVITVTVERIGSHVRISVADRGSGIPKSFHGQVFKDFTQADASDTRRTAGVGLGLAVAKRLAERIDANLDFDPEVATGAIFFLEVPHVAPGKSGA